MMIARLLSCSLAAAGLAIAMAATPVQAVPMARPDLVGAASGITQVRFHGGHGHFHGGFHRGGFHHGGFHRFHGGFHRRIFVRPRFYGYGPYYAAPFYRCPVVMTVYGPRRICAYRRIVRPYGWYRPHYRHFHRYHHFHRRWL
jgi:hypothetical protein